MGVVYGRADDLVKTIQRCVHCGDECNKSAKFCKHCTTADARREMCAENEKIFADAGLKLKLKVCAQ